MSRYIAGAAHLEQEHELYQKERLTDKLLIVRNSGILYCILIRDNRIYRAAREERSDFPIGTILIGKVSNVVKQLEGVFLDLENAKNRKSTAGYLPIREKDTIRPFNREPDGRILNGDELLVQVVKEADKTKPIQLTARLSLAGQFVVVKNGSGRTEYSVKLDRAARERLERAFTKWKKKLAEENSAARNAPGENQVLFEKTDIMFRTNSIAADWDSIGDEIIDLYHQLKRIDQISQSRTSYSILYEPELFYLEFLKNLRLSSLQEIVTDEEDVFAALQKSEYTRDIPLRLYEDKTISLKEVYSLNTRLRELLLPKAYMKSGAYLVIEQTEALVSIDVNTGQAQKRTSPEEFFFQTNLEAVREACYQLSARNLSGMILIDFINMKDREHVKKLLEALQEEVGKDAVPTRFVDFTKLGLAELTRKKTSRTLRDVLREWTT